MIRRYFPKSLYARILLIVILPIFITQSLVTYIFFVRHWDLVTANLSENVAGQIALISRQYENAETDTERTQLMNEALEDLDIRVRYAPAMQIPEDNQLARFNVYNATLDRRLRRALAWPYWMNTQSWPNDVEIRVQLGDGALIFFAQRDRVFATTGPIFLFWLIATSILIGATAIIFMRNQVRSILRLANAAEAFGRGRDSPDYRPTGATEVRKAGYAFIAMRERIKRHLEQRTAMLAGVSHDLRTPLTRIKLALAMQPNGDEINALRSDVLEMEKMVEAYLDFARNEAVDEEPKSFRVASLFDEITSNVERSGRCIIAAAPSNVSITARRSALHRATSNLVNNGLRYADNVWLSARRTDRFVEITVDDDGPGIAPEQYEDVFKPFVRLDAARNQNESGVGMGLTIVRDVARAHGGDVSLDKSDYGGLKATIRLPI
ncbi:ATP-binding protein [Hyphococcus flavus]|uniref:histidine kinase n=1 Tax=Hyphococcus flavus TaxID=1866326 RepID=A0AAE9ZGU3_9PROT|nr:ATP-binding protein [Hyphococcus flavus]WDI30591.1 ATP-binding protein [Hyphococcus flavus]